MSDRIRVAMLAPYLHGTGGGSAKHIEKTIDYMSRRKDIDLHVLSIGNKTDKIEAGNFKLHVIEKPAYPFSLSINLPGFTMRICRLIRTIDPHVIHAIGTFPPYSTAAALLRNKYPSVLTVMGLVMRDVKYLKGLRRIYTKLIKETNEKYVLSKIPFIIVQSGYIKDIVAKISKSNISIIPEGIAFYEIQNLKDHVFNRSIDIFLAVQLWRLKGIDILIKSAHKAIKALPDLKICIAGTGIDEENYKEMVRELGLEKNIEFLGYLSDEKEIISYYNTCKIVVVPSRWDVDPFAPLNAAASGKPSIVSNMCNSSIIKDGETGFVFQSEDIDDLSNKIIRLLTDHTLRNNMGREALMRAKGYDWSEVISKDVAIYRKAIEEFKRI